MILIKKKFKCLKIFQKNIKIFQKKIKNISKLFKKYSHKFPKNVKKNIKKKALKILHDNNPLMAKSKFFEFSIIFIINFHYLESLEVMKFRFDCLEIMKNWQI